MHDHTSLLIVGAGPFGLATAVYADFLGIDYVMVGEPMGFWRRHMPVGMRLRSGCDWHLDPLGVHTIAAYLATRGATPAEVEPLSVDFYLGYASWFQEHKGLVVLPRTVQRLDAANGRFAAVFDDGGRLTASAVVLAVGLGYFPHIPAKVAAVLPPGCGAHTGELVNLAALRGQRCLIVGGRQSAFEWAALLHEAGAAEVHVCHRHPSPRFAAADWSWVSPLVDATVEDPGWFRNLPLAQRDELGWRLWAEGRLKVEPWLGPRVDHPAVRIWPNRRLSSCQQQPTGELVVGLDSGETLAVDQVVFATGYQPDITRIPFLNTENLLGQMVIRNGYPALDQTCQTTVPGLFATSMLAVQDFGPFFAFTVAVRASAVLIGRAVHQQLAGLDQRQHNR